MNSQQDERIGEQSPRVKLDPESNYSHAEDAAALAEAYGLAPDRWQYDVLDSWTAVHPDGKWAAARCGLSVPRQNGKNAVLEIIELYKLVFLKRKILHTAHEVKTARKAFLRLCTFFENDRQHPEMTELVKSIRRTNGQEAIELLNGGSIEFIARSKNSGRGFTVDDLVCDEAQSLTDEVLAALLPTISAAPSGNPQTIFTGTPPGDDFAGAVWTRTRNQGVTGSDPRLSWFEWSVPDDFDTTKYSPKELMEFTWQTNPALGIRLDIGTVEDECQMMAPDTFARERLGKWNPPAKANRAIPQETWEETGIPVEKAQILDGLRSFGIAFTYDGRFASLAGAIRHETGVHVELVEQAADGMESRLANLAAWIGEPARVAKMSEIVIAGAAYSDLLQAMLLEAGVPKRAIRVIRTRDYLTACAAFDEGLKSRQITHTKAKGQAALDECVETVGKRFRASGTWSWAAGENNPDVTPIEACSIAAWSVQNTHRDPRKKQRIMRW